MSNGPETQTETSDAAADAVLHSRRRMLQLGAVGVEGQCGKYAQNRRRGRSGHAQKHRMGDQRPDHRADEQPRCIGGIARHPQQDGGAKLDDPGDIAVASTEPATSLTGE